MFAPAHMAVGALCESALKKKLLTAAVAFVSAGVLDSTRIWHAPYPWPEDTPAILKIIPYPDHLAPILVVIVLVTLTIGVGWLLRRYWWGMLWGMAPDIIDWAILRPAIGREPIHDLFGKVETPWGFGLEMAFVALVVFVVLKGRLPLPTKT